MKRVDVFFFFAFIGIRIGTSNNSKVRREK